MDEATGNYWYWNLADFVRKTYDEQIAAIADLNIAPPYGNIAGGWHMPSLSEIQQLFNNPLDHVVDNFSWPAHTIQCSTSFIRFNEAVHKSGEDCHYTTKYSNTTLFGSLLMFPFPDETSHPHIGSWVTTEAAVVPAPPAVVLATTGLLCLLGAKLRGRWRRR